MSKENRVSDELATKLDALAAHFEAACHVGDAYMVEENAADAKTLRDAAAALRSKPVAGVEVKPLEWAPLSEYGPDAERASGILPGLYGVFIDQDSAAGAILSEWSETSDTLCTTAAKTLGRFASFEEAKDAAQSDYRKRILSAIHPNQESGE